MLNVRIISPDGVLFEGVAGNVVLPGELGTFEVLPLHRPLASRLRAGVIEVERRRLAIRRGAVSVADDVVTAVVETE